MADTKQNRPQSRPTAHVNLTKRITIPGKGKRYCPVVVAANGKLKPDLVIVNGHEEVHSEGAYYMEWVENGKRIRKSLGADAVQAMALARQQDEKINTQVLLSPVLDHIKRVLGMPLANDPQEDAPFAENAVSLNDAMAAFIAEKKATRKERTYVQYEQAFNLFRQSCKKRNLLDIERKDVLDFITYLRDRKYSPRTINHIYGRLISFLGVHGIRPMQRGDSPKYTQDETEVYEKEDLQSLWKACATDEQRLWWEFFLKSGFRKQEVMYLTWDEISFSRKTVSVKYKAEYGFSPKNYRGREVPLPDDLLVKLKEWRAQNPNAMLVFPAKHGGVKRDFYEHLHRIVKKAGLNRSRYWLHKFRSTFCTWHLWAGVDVRTVMKWAGHQDLETTLRYLKPNQTDTVREKVNSTFA